MDHRSALLIGSGIFLLVAAVTFPLWSLAGYAVTAEQVDDPTVGDKQEGDVLAFEDLDAADRQFVETAIDRDGPVVVYGPYYGHQSASGDLPSVIEDRWLNDYEIGSYVEYDGQYYEISAAVHGEPLLFVPIVIVGGGLGLVVLAIGLVGRARGWAGHLAYAGTAYCLSTASGLLVALLLLAGNVSGYVWPIQ